MYLYMDTAIALNCLSLHYWKNQLYMEDEYAQFAFQT